MPNLTSKELTVVEDQLTREQLTVKKFRLYSHTAADPVIRLNRNFWHTTVRRVR